MLRDAPTDFHRYLYSEIDWDDRLIGIKGPRGAGKTTLLLQNLKEHFSGDRETAFYLSLDNLWVYSHDIMEAVEYLYTHGVRHLFLDEVHRFLRAVTEDKHTALPPAVMREIRPEKTL